MVENADGRGPIAPGKDKYKRLKRLGNGASGEAFLIQSKINHKLWVVKMVDLNNMGFDERVRSRDEARILQVLNHPNIVQFKDVFKDKKLNLNIVMEYADDGTLQDKI